MTRSTTISLALLLAACFAGSAFSQRWSDGFGNSVFNPNSSLEMDPSFIYDSRDGMFYVENIGPNGVIDSTDNSNLLGDDFGLRSLLITAQDTFVAPVLPLFDNGVVWQEPVYFNNKIQFFGQFLTGQFLPIAEEPTAIFQLSPNLSADDFRNSDGEIVIETGVGFAPLSPGATLFSVGDPIATGAFRIVPEPGSLGMFMMASLGLLSFWRRTGG